MKRRIDGLKAMHVYLSKYSPRSLGNLTEEESQCAAAARHTSFGSHASR